MSLLAAVNYLNIIPGHWLSINFEIHNNASNYNTTKQTSIELAKS